MSVVCLNYDHDNEAVWTRLFSTTNFSFLFVENQTRIVFLLNLKLTYPADTFLFSDSCKKILSSFQIIMLEKLFYPF